MLKLAILLVAALASVDVTLAQLDLVYIANDPYVQSLKKGQETCSYSSPDWVVTFFHPRLTIESIFSEIKYGEQNPTVQRSIRLTFHRQLKKSPWLTSFYLEQQYSVPTPDFDLYSTFDSGYSSVPGWLDITTWSPNLVIINDWSTGSIIEIYRNGNQHYNLYLYSSKSFLETAGGLLIEGCPYNAVFPWNTPYNPNPNIGRRRRQADRKECSEIAASFGEAFPTLSGFSAENILKICLTDSEFFENTPRVLRETLEAAHKAVDLYNKNFGDNYKPPSDEEFQEV